LARFVRSRPVTENVKLAPSAVGGLILYGLIVLFVGAVVFSIGYRMITATMADSEEEAAVGDL